MRDHPCTKSFSLLFTSLLSVSRAIGIAINPLITRTLNDEEKYPIEQLLIDDEMGQLGPGGARALATAIMGTGPGMKGGPYKLLKYIRLWRTNCGDDGTASIVRNPLLFLFTESQPKANDCLSLIS